MGNPLSQPPQASPAPQQSSGCDECCSCGCLSIGGFALAVAILPVLGPEGAFGLVVILVVLAWLWRTFGAAKQPGPLSPAATQEPPPAAPVPPPSQPVIPAVPAGVAKLYASRRCGVCGRGFALWSGFAECPECHRWYHEECWRQSGGCVTDGCPAMVARGVQEPGEVPPSPPPTARAIHNVGICPYCQTAVAEGTFHQVCPACHTPHHADCWEENNGCSVYGCRVRIRG